MSASSNSKNVVEDTVETVVEAAVNSNGPNRAPVKIGPMNTGLVGLGLIAWVAVTGIREVSAYKRAQLNLKTAEKVEEVAT